MLFDTRMRTINRLLIVEDEPLVAFENEHGLAEAGYHVVATVDGVEAAIRVIENDNLDLVLADIHLSDDGNGIEVARAAHDAGVLVLFVSGHCPAGAQRFAIGCLAKPYRTRDLLDAIDAIEAKLQRKAKRRLPAGLTLYGEEE